MKRFFIHAGLYAALLAGVPAFAQDSMTTNDPNAGAYDALSPGNQKIVNAIYDSHIEATENVATDTTTSEGMTTEGATAETKPLTHDDIAAMKADGGWGKTYKQLYAEGQVTHKNLGQAISSFNHSAKTAPTTDTPTVVTTGSGQKIIAGGKKGGGSSAASVRAGGQGGGKKFGHHKNTVVTTGAGSTSVAGPASHSTAGGAAGATGAGGSKGRGRGGASHKGK